MTISQAQLFIGSRTILEKETIIFLQNYFCKNSGCATCTACVQIAEKRHHGTLWIEPEKRYSLEHLEIIFKKAKLSLDGNQACFFILTKADFLSPACANSLLKLVEEPPPSYHFLFLAERLAHVLPTIRSRCTQKLFSTLHDTQDLPALVQHFTRFESDPLMFNKELPKCTMTEQECLVYVDELLRYWITAYKQALTQNNTTQQQKSLGMISLLKKMLKTPPAPGSSKLFWKNLFLQREKASKGSP